MSNTSMPVSPLSASLDRWAAAGVLALPDGLWQAVLAHADSYRLPRWLQREPSAGAAFTYLLFRNGKIARPTQELMQMVLPVAEAIALHEDGSPRVGRRWAVEAALLTSDMTFAAIAGRHPNLRGGARTVELYHDLFFRVNRYRQQPQELQVQVLGRASRDPQAVLHDYALKAYAVNHTLAELDEFLAVVSGAQAASAGVRAALRELDEDRMRLDVHLTLAGTAPLSRDDLQRLALYDRCLQTRNRPAAAAPASDTPLLSAEQTQAKAVLEAVLAQIATQQDARVKQRETDVEARFRAQLLQPAEVKT